MDADGLPTGRSAIYRFISQIFNNERRNLPMLRLLDPSAQETGFAGLLIGPQLC